MMANLMLVELLIMVSMMVAGGHHNLAMCCPLNMLYCNHTKRQAASYLLGSSRSNLDVALYVQLNKLEHLLLCRLFEFLVLELLMVEHKVEDSHHLHMTTHKSLDWLDGKAVDSMNRLIGMFQLDEEAMRKVVDLLALDFRKEAHKFLLVNNNQPVQRQSIHLVLSIQKYKPHQHNNLLEKVQVVPLLLGLLLPMGNC